MEDASSVSTEIVVREDGRISIDGGGAIQINVDGRRLNKYLDKDDNTHDDSGLVYGWKGYTGDDIVADMTSILKTTHEIISERHIYGEKIVQFAGYNDYLVLEYLGDNKMRIAFRCTKAIDEDYKSDDSDSIPEPWSACGKVVGLKDWVKELVDASAKLQEELEKNEEEGNAEWISDKTKPLRDFLDQK